MMHVTERMSYLFYVYLISPKIANSTRNAMQCNDIYFLIVRRQNNLIFKSYKPLLSLLKAWDLN